MTRKQRLAERRHFENLCFLRTLYPMRGEYDSVSCISVEDVIRAAEASLQNETTAVMDASTPTGRLIDQNVQGSP